YCRAGSISARSFSARASCSSRFAGGAKRTCCSASSFKAGVLSCSSTPFTAGVLRFVTATTPCSAAALRVAVPRGGDDALRDRSSPSAICPVPCLFLYQRRYPLHGFERLYWLVRRRPRKCYTRLAQFRVASYRLQDAHLLRYRERARVSENSTLFSR